jgi:hypothetical protein
MWKRAFAKPTLVLAFFMSPLALASTDNDAAQILEASQVCVAAHSVELQQTIEQTARLLADGKPPVDVPTKKQTSVIEIDAGKKLIRMTTKEQGEELVVIRRGNRIAMKIGSGPWTKPQGPYARMGEQLANPFACPLPKPQDQHSPKWTIVGNERLDGRETTVAGRRR